MSKTNHDDRQNRLWRSLDELEQTPRHRAARQNEFWAENPSELEVPRVNRRKFLGLMGATGALAGVSLPGCVRKPKQQILPYAKRPEDLVPGSPRFFATNAYIAGSVLGLLVESQDGRPTKIEGNPDHPQSLGATTAWAQAEVLSLYDPERSRTPLKGGKKSDWKTALAELDGRLEALAKRDGEGLCLVLEPIPSPTLRAQLRAFARRFPAAKVFFYDEPNHGDVRAGMALAGVRGAAPWLSLKGAEVVVALDADPLGSDPDATRLGREFADGRRVTAPEQAMNRLYAVEPFFTVTGGAADHRLQLPSSQVGAFLAVLAGRLLAGGLALPAGAEALAEGLKGARGEFGKWPAALAKDLLRVRGKSALVVGPAQPAEVHALGLLLNAALGNLGRSVGFVKEDAAPEAGTVVELAAALAKGTVDTLVMLGGNPVHTAPADLGLGALIARAGASFYLGAHLDETGKLCSWHLPRSHFLEAWGDLRASDGTIGVQQPLIAPLFDSRSDLELLAHLGGAKTERGYELVRSHWHKTLQNPADFDARWRRWLHDGLLGEVKADPAAPAFRWDAVATAWAKFKPLVAPSAAALEINFRPCPKLYDGRYANNGWLQELPDPVTKLTWDNAACLGPKTAKALGVSSMDLLKLDYDGRTVKLPAWVVPGTAEHTVTVALGYGRTAGGEVALGVGQSAEALRTAEAPFFGAGLKVSQAGKRRHILATTQEHHSMEGRPILREDTLGRYRKEPDFAPKAQIHPPLKSIWTEPNETKGHQWGMTVDLTLCTGCNACVMACQAENNVPVVGKRRVTDGREMHWVRVDRYFGGDPDDPTMSMQPMACQHCELAPCEGVCPVAATVHSPEGLNDMAYNRCIGTRYCSNNCPYKVRRFNFFQYNGDIDPVSKLQKNPDVTVRFRGVMEKCTYCVQRINEAKIAAKRDGDGTVPDGAILPACMQACPTRAIEFGNLNDKKSKVVARKAEPRNYAVLSELNIKPRTTYLAKLRNPNPELV